MVEVVGIEPTSASPTLRALHAYSVFNLAAGYPTGRENRQRAWMSFNESTPGVLHRDPVSVTPVIHLYRHRAGRGHYAGF